MPTPVRWRNLRRFLNGEPIKARPVGRVEWAWRWCRRNPGKALAGTAAILGILIYAVSVSILAGMLNEKKKEAESARDSALVAKNNAMISEGKAVKAQGIAEQNQQQQRQTADAALRQMVEMVEKLHGVMQSKRLSINASPEIRRLRTEVLTRCP